ncbi:MAG: hypothetical protein IKE51_03170 [Solobacterium sp.]|nr:hypothetical protein [Solobacterium sp.]
MDDAVFRYGFPVIATILSFYYAFRILVLKDNAIVMSRTYRITKDEEGYAKKAAYLFIIFGILQIIYALLMNWNLVYAYIFLVIGIIGIFIAFRFINKEHGIESHEDQRKKKKKK